MTVRYRNVLVRVIVSLIASIAILFYGHEPEKMVGFFSDPSFYITLAASFPIALLLIYLIYRVTKWLDTRFDWRQKPYKRTGLQFLLGVIGPTLVDLGLVLIFSKIYGVTFTLKDFYRVDLPMIMCFTIIVNLGYIISYLVRTEPQLMLHKSDVLDVDEKSHELTIRFHSSLIKLNLLVDVIYFYKLHNNVKVVTQNKTFTVKDSIGDLEARYSGIGFFRINRKTIVNMEYVIGHLPGNKRDTRQVEFNIPMIEPKEDTFLITENALKSFQLAIQAK